MKKNQLIILIIGLLCIAPVLLSYALYFYFPAWQPTARSHQGTLIHPARPLPDAIFETLNKDLVHFQQLKGKWTLFVVTTGGCEQVCQQQLYHIRQVRLALNQDSQRVQRILFILDKSLLTQLVQLEQEYMGTWWLTSPDLSRWLAAVETDINVLTQHVYLLDPLGNLVMRYDTAQQTTGLLKDLKKLLKLSKIG